MNRGLSVAFGMNYPADEARRLWAEGRYPGSHLWGGASLEAAGHVVRYVGLGRHGRARTQAGARLQSVLGRRVPQLSAATSGADVVLAGDPSTFAALALLRRAGLLRRPVVAVVHPSASTSAVMARVLRSYDVVVCLSRETHRVLVGVLGRDPARTLLAPYGPDLSWVGYQPRPGLRVVSSGKTHRDEQVLLHALRATGLAARVHTRDHVGTTQLEQVEHVGLASYPVVLGDLQTARIVAIPLLRTDGTFGITELNDALALGKPVIMTRNPHIDLDVEKVGCGRLVAPGDVAAWVAALRELDDPQLSHEMGQRGRAFAEKSWNADLFGEVVLRAVRIAADG